MLCVQDIIEKQEFSGSFDNNDNNDVVCLRLPVLYCPGRGKGWSSIVVSQRTLYKRLQEFSVEFLSAVQK